MWQQLIELWNRFTRKSEEWEYFEYSDGKINSHDLSHIEQ